MSDNKTLPNRVLILNSIESYKAKGEEIVKSVNREEEELLEKELLELKEFILNDIGKRQNFLLDLAQVVSKEKEEYFNLEIKIQRKNKNGSNSA